MVNIVKKGRLIQASFFYAPQEVPLGCAPQEVPLGYAPQEVPLGCAPQEVPLGYVFYIL